MPTATAAVAASTADEVTEGPDRSEPMMNTISGSHRGWMRSATTSGSPRSSASAAATWPRTVARPPRARGQRLGPLAAGGQTEAANQGGHRADRGAVGPGLDQPGRDLIS